MEYSCLEIVNFLWQPASAPNYFSLVGLSAEARLKNANR
jgi:hypothetical protein